MKSVLFVAGGWQGHEPQKCAEVFAGHLKSKDYCVEIAESLEVFDQPDKLAALDLIIPTWSMGRLTSQQEQNLCLAVRQGCGLAGWHGGICDGFRASTEFQFMAGGQFVAHPGNILDYQIKITRPEDPIMAGVSDFSLRSEQYYLHVDPSNQVLAETVFDGRVHEWINGCVMPVVWKRYYGIGRVFCCALGHVADEFKEYPQIKEIILRGLLWASR